MNDWGNIGKHSGWYFDILN